VDRWKWTHTNLTEDEKEAGGRWVTFYVLLFDKTNALKITASCLSVIGDDGKTQSIFGFTIDITAQKRATMDLTKALAQARKSEEERIAEARFSAQQKEQLENFDILFSMSECGLFEYSVDGRLTKANEAFFNMSGFDRDLSKQDVFTFQNLVCPDDLEHILSVWTKIAETGFVLSRDLSQASLTPTQSARAI
jgi:PAS domain-containing protein